VITGVVEGITEEVVVMITPEVGQVVVQGWGGQVVTQGVAQVVGSI
jgi:hypothetical protein